MDLGLYPETETGRSLLGLRFPFPPTGSGWGRAGGQTFFSTKPTSRAWSRPSQESGATGATGKTLSPADLHTSDLGAAFVIVLLSLKSFFPCKK